MARSYARLQTRSAPLSSEFGRSWATDLFGAAAIASLPLLKSGPHKGQPKGYVLWRKAIVAGYCRDVSKPLAIDQLADAWIGEFPGTPRDAAMQGQWMGRVQPLAGAAHCMFQAARDRHDAEIARNAADWEAEKAERAEARGGQP